MSESLFVKRKMQYVINISKIVTIHYHEFDKNYVFDGETHDFWEMVYIDKGNVTVTCDQGKIKMMSGEVIFHKPNEFHNIMANGVIAPNIFVISFESSSPAIKYFVNKHLTLPKELINIIRCLLYESQKTFDIPFFDPASLGLKLLKSPIFGGQQMIKIYLEQLLINIIRNDKATKLFDSRKKYESHIVENIIDYLENNMYDILSLDDICNYLNYGKTYLCKLFKEETDTSIIKYYNNLKIEEAKKLIRERNYNFTQISNLLNFNNPHYFTYNFRKYAGMSPREYSNSVKPF